MRWGGGGVGGGGSKVTSGWEGRRGGGYVQRFT